jgi:hypothetical protein
MNNNFKKFFFYYLSLLFVFSIIYLIKKHDVGNDSTISEWIINYSGGFTKRGIIGEICILIANTFNLNLRDSILIFQIIIIAIYFVLLFILIKDIKTNRILIFSIFSPIFILYPVAEIEVLARKEIFIFCIFILYLLINNFFLRNLYKIIFLSLAVLIWEPVIFYFIFFLAVDVIDNKWERMNKKFFFNLFFYVPALLIGGYIALNPITSENHAILENFLTENFGESCYMSCGMLLSKASLYAQFESNFDKYSFVVFFRYFFIILFGFGALIILSKNSNLIFNNTFFFKYFPNLFLPISIMLLPIIILFAMGFDWGRWVNISYVFSITFYLYLYKNEKIILKNFNLDKSSFKFLNNNKIFIIILIFLCFGWNPKTVMTGDIATNPLWKVPYNASKHVFGFGSFRILQDSPLSIWHKKFIE